MSDNHTDRDGPTNNNNNNNHYHTSGARPLFSMTMDPNAIERELDHVASELHSTVSSVLNTMHSSFLGGLDSLSREVQHLEDQHRQFPWTFRHFSSADGVDAAAGAPKKRYRITIEEIPPSSSSSTEEEDNAAGPMVVVQGRTPNKAEMEEKEKKNKNEVLLAKEVDGHGRELFSIHQGKVGTRDEGKTVITTTSNSSIAPGLLDWLLFTTHEDSFFRQLGRGAAEHHHHVPVSSSTTAAKIEEIQDRTAAAVPSVAAVTPSSSETDQQQRQPSAIVDKVKRVGASWERGARDWWHWGNEKWHQHRHPQDSYSAEEVEDRRAPFWLRRENSHVLAGSGLDPQSQQEEEVEARPRWQSWGRHESFSQTTVTRPDGTIESKMVSSLNGETETRTKLIHPDGTIEETVTHDRSHHPDNGHYHGWGGSGDGHHHGPLAAHVHVQHAWPHAREAMGSAKKDERVVVPQNGGERRQEEEEAVMGDKKRSWPPKAWLRRQEQEQTQTQERNV
ncbi:hypothetical protein DFQ27_002776 [Actinomortierella ambigua]|uniref:Uncharacterized protein n=1 Tax=Actinomortierella ambigua TaxID=1343610 RepID=A0A9P6Q9Z3_9FUNG|nr:hypothetical protein DFQ27_002776 [Actinomortierella ambigua]